VVRHPLVARIVDAYDARGSGGDADATGRDAAEQVVRARRGAR
jgi:phosphate starvation-inducible PhoH-like protein